MERLGFGPINNCVRRPRRRRLPTFRLALYSKPTQVRNGCKYLRYQTKKIFQNFIFGGFKLATEITLIFFVSVGLVFQMLYGGMTSEQYFAKENKPWILMQEICIIMVYVSCGTMTLSFLATLIIVTKDFLRKRKLQQLQKLKTERPEYNQ